MLLHEKVGYAPDMMKVHVIAETDELLVLNKPAGLITHGDGRTVEPSLAEWIAARYPSMAAVGEPWVSPQGESVPVSGLVHRLDRTTSGVLLAAKTDEAFAALRQAFKERRVEKTYRVFVYGHMELGAGRIVSEIARTTEPPKRWYAKPCDETDVRAAITEWRVLERMSDLGTGEPVSYLEARPFTGRTHQIRVHLASIGNPIIADHLYAEGRPALLGFARPALHANAVSLELGGVRRDFTAPLPPDMVHALQAADTVLLT